MCIFWLSKVTRVTFSACKQAADKSTKAVISVIDRDIRVILSPFGEGSN
jgi:hypothetical protein